MFQVGIVEDDERRIAAELQCHDTTARVEGCDGHGGQVVRPRIGQSMIHDGGCLR
jgi:hypothetical protein